MKITNKYNLDRLVVKSVESDYQYKDKQYSVTSILTDYKEIVLKRRHHDEIIKDVSDMAWLMFGTAFHEFMEKQEVEYVEVTETVYRAFSSLARDYKEEHSVNESGDTDNLNVKYYIKPKLKEEYLRYKCKYSDYTLTGRSDLYNILKNEVIDYKTASVNKVLYSDWDDYIKQLKLYAVMLRSMGYPCNRGRLIVFLKDWSQSTYIRDPKNYPSSPIFEIGWEFSHLDLEEEKNWIEDYFIKLEMIEQLEDNAIVECNDEVRKFGRKPTFAVMKNNNVRATKIFDTEAEANEYIRYNKFDLGKDKYWVKERPAEDVRCKIYCDSCHWCNHYIENFANVVLVDETTNKAVMGFDSKYDADYYLRETTNAELKNLKLIIKKEEVEENGND